MSEDKRKTQKNLAVLREEAGEYVRYAYDRIPLLDRLSLDTINRGADLPFCFKQEFLRHWFSRAEAVATFAVNLGLLTPDEVIDIMRDFQNRHPEFADTPSQEPPEADAQLET